MLSFYPTVLSQIESFHHDSLNLQRLSFYNTFLVPFVKKSVQKLLYRLLHYNNHWFCIFLSKRQDRHGQVTALHLNISDHRVHCTDPFWHH